MSWDERLFSFFYHRAESLWKGHQPAGIKLESYRRQSEVLLSALCETRIEIRDSEDWGGFQGSILFLPGEFGFLSLESDQLLYLEWRLLAASVDFENFGIPRSNLGIQIVLTAFPRLQKNFDLLAPKFQNPQYQNRIFEVWLGQTPTKIDLPPSSPLEDLNFRKESFSKGTEVHGKTKDRAQWAYVNDKSENPLTHVFEKVITAEDFQGGHRKMDGSDEILQQSDALSEINLSHIVRTQQSTDSIYKSNAVIEVGDPSVEQHGSTLKNRIVFKYPEWFERKKCYVKDWCTVFEQHSTRVEAPLNYDKKVADELRAQLESCYSSYQWFSRQKEGSEIDLVMAVDRVVQFFAGSKGMGGTPIDNIYLRRRRFNHDFAIQILIDSSLSSDSYARGRRVMDTTQEALNIFSSAFQEVLDEMSVASFSSFTRNQVNYDILKDFSDPWDILPGRIAGLKPDGYTRIGPALRHSGVRLARSRARKKMVLLISDAKPTDYDHYEGCHGIHDLQKAASELNAQGCVLKVLVLADKKQSHHNFSFGPNHCMILKDVRELSHSLFHFWYEALSRSY